MSSLTVSLAVLAVTASSLVRPTGRATLLEDVKTNIKAFSPYQSAVIVTVQAIDLLNWRLINIAEIHASLWALAGVHFYVPETRSTPSKLSHGLLVTAARRTLLVGTALPLYLFLIRSSCHWAIKWPMAFLLAEAAMVELSAWYLNISCAGVVLRTDWPRHPIITKGFFASGPCPGNHVQDASDIATVDNRQGHDSENCLPTTGENLCDRVRRIWSPDTRPNKEIPVGRHPLENIPNIAHITSPAGPVWIPWTCGHWRCLLYMVLRVLVRALLYSVVAVDFGLAAWFLHDNAQAVLIRISRILLAEKILNDLLTLTFLSAVAVLLGIAIYLIFVVVVPWIFRTSSYLQPARQMVVNLVHGIPSSLKVVARTGVFWISLFLSRNVARVLIQRDPILTDSILSYSMELLIVPLIALSVYRRLFVPTKQISPRSLGTEFLQDPELTPSDLPSTSKPEEIDHCGDDANNEEARKERLLLPKFRLTILLPNAAIWIFRWWLMSVA